MNKQDFPLFETYPELIYLDNAATTQKPFAVLESLNNYYRTANANVHRGIYSLSETATANYEAARNVIAASINADREEVIFTSGTTEGINLLADYYFAAQLKPNDVIVVSDMEHHSNFLPWQRLARKSGAILKFLKLNSDFRLDPAELTGVLKEFPVKVVALSYMSNVLGTINPVKEIAAIIRNYSPDTKLVIDAAQAYPHLPLNVKDLDCDFLAASGHKIYGPTGTGFIYGRKELLEQAEPWFVGGGMVEKVERKQTSWAQIPERFEAGTPNIAGAIALAAAVNYLKDLGWDKILSHEAELTEYGLKTLQSFPELKLYGPSGIEQRGPVFSFSIPQIHAHDLAQMLDEHDIAVRAGHHCCQILHREVLGTAATLRVSLGIYNEKQELDRFAQVLKEILSSWKVR